MMNTGVREGIAIGQRFIQTESHEIRSWIERLGLWEQAKFGDPGGEQLKSALHRLGTEATRILLGWHERLQDFLLKSAVAAIRATLISSTVASAIMLVTYLSLGVPGAFFAAGIFDNVVRPFLLKGRGVTEMHPYISLIALLGGVHLFGVLGMFLGPVLMALLLALLQVWPAVARGYFGGKGERGS